MKTKLTFLLIMFPILTVLVGCKSDVDKTKETIEAYLYKNMKNPESLKILSCEVRSDTIPFYLSEEILDLADKYSEAMNDFVRYKDRSYLWAEEKLQSIQKAGKAKETFETAYNSAKENALDEVETIAYVRSSGTNPMGGTVSNSTIFIIDKNDPTKILGTFIVDSDFIRQFVVIKMVGEGYKFSKNKFGKYETDKLPYFEQFVMNDVD